MCFVSLKWNVPLPCKEALWQLAEDYHVLTERFDRSVCTGGYRNGTIMPRNGQELGVICRNALRLRKEITLEAAKHGFSGRELHDAIIHLGKHRYLWIDKV